MPVPVAAPIVDEVSVLPQVGTVEELICSPVSCFCELLPHQSEPTDLLFPWASSTHAGEVPAPDWWSERDGRIRALHLFKVRDAYVFPAWGIVLARGLGVMRLTMEEARYHSPDLSGLPGTVLGREGLAFTPPESPASLASAAVVMPWGSLHNYGHFVMDALPSLAILDEVGALGRFPPIVPALKPWQARHFALMGATPRVLTEEVVAVQDVVFTSGMHHFLHALNFNLRGVPERQLSRAAVSGRADGKRRLYLSRGPENQRAMASESRLVAALAAVGFEAIDTGRMGVDEQIRRFATADVVLGATGAAFANAIYCRPGTRVIEIQPAGMQNHWVQGLCFVMGLHHAAYFCDAKPVDPRRPERGMRYDLDVERFIAFAFGLPPLDREAPPPLPADPLFVRLKRRLRT